MIRIRTHVVSLYRSNGGLSGDHMVCNRCGMKIPPSPDNRPFPPGLPVGVIETTVIPPSSYRVGENDSNRRCDEDE